MKLDQLTLANKTIEVVHPDDDGVSISVVIRHPDSHEYNLARSELAKDKDIVIACAIAEAATVEIRGIDDFDNSKESISQFLRDPRFFWVAARIATPFIEQKKSSVKG